MRNTSAILLAFLLLAPAVASAQVSTLSVTASPTSFGVGDCGKTFTFTITAKDASNIGVGNLQNSDRWNLTVSENSDCSNGGAVDAGPVAASPAGNYTVKITGADLIDAGLGEASCATASVSDTLYFCAGFDNETGSDPSTAKASVTVDTVPAGAPVLDSVKPGDERLYLHFTPAEGEDSPDNWRVCYRQISAGTGGSGGEGGTGGTGTDTAGLDGDAGAGGDAGTGGTEAAAGGTGGDVGTGGTGGEAGTGGTGGTGGEAGAGGTGGTGGSGGSTGGGVVSDICDNGKRSERFSGLKRNFTLDGLRNGVTYEVAVQAIDTNGAVSDPSNVMTGTPVPTADYWDLYRDAGGDEQGGCSTGGGSILLGLLAAGFFFARRQGRR